MTRVVLAGGIGAGKTAATAYLAAKGFAVVDADLIARDVERHGTPAWTALVDAFGSAVLDAQGEIDRRFLADVVFHDATALRRLNQITHPAIGRAIADALDAAQGAVVFAALPLYWPELGQALKIDEVWVIEVTPETAVARLREGRGFSDEDARARLAAQKTNEERRELADRVIDNEGSLERLHERLDEALAELAGRRD